MLFRSLPFGSCWLIDRIATESAPLPAAEWSPMFRPTFCSSELIMIADSPSDTTSTDLTIWVGCLDSIEQVVGAGSPLLLVESDPVSADRFRSRLLDEPGELDVCLATEVLAAEADADILWHHFNDSRLNGPLDLGFWQATYPNLRLIHSEHRRGRRLADVLDDWHASRQPAAKTELQLHLHLRQGDPISVLSGFSDWFDQLQTVHLDMAVLDED